jgi:hypothetical protein
MPHGFALWSAVAWRYIETLNQELLNKAVQATALRVSGIVLAD